MYIYIIYNYFDLITDKKIISITAGNYHSFGLLEDGSVLAWGSSNLSGSNTIPITDKKFMK